MADWSLIADPLIQCIIAVAEAENGGKLLRGSRLAIGYWRGEPQTI